ncbi:hypothetical protein LEP1GSC060_0840 [Leptospira weilii serovar Ranarum str. ICFT]|uniref:Uncharacterized protein n=1 Tax=Leptospira weilii serovar Ranarum str. ICFT TaxID=1218598 RepID=N1WPF6_9LEPT|nr:hypothetical protein LEP1GSC060_0840 [Leptospira weilii serovar Ranarum str. ICFT]
MHSFLIFVFYFAAPLFSYKVGFSKATFISEAKEKHPWKQRIVLLSYKDLFAKRISTSRIEFL